jgi:hypothetical protein
MGQYGCMCVWLHVFGLWQYKKSCLILMAIMCMCTCFGSSNIRVSMGVCMCVYVFLCVRHSSSHKGEIVRLVCMCVCMYVMCSLLAACGKSRYGCMSYFYVFGTATKRVGHGCMYDCVCTAAARGVGMGVGMCGDGHMCMRVYVCTLRLFMIIA